MPFWLHDSRLIYRTRHFSKKIRLLISCAILSSIFLFWNIVFYFSYCGQSDQLLNIQKNLTEEKNAFLKALSSSEETVIKIDSMKDDLDNAKNSIVSMHDDLNALVGLLKKNGLQCSSMMPVKRSTKRGIEKHFYTLKAYGSFSNIFSFFKSASSVDYCLRFHQVEIQRLQKSHESHEGHVLLLLKFYFVNTNAGSDN